MTKHKDFILPILFSFTLFVSAALMFTVQPMAGKMLTPLFGGAPSTWLAAMVYFQVSLLVGYTLAFGLSRFSPRVHILTLCVLLLGGWFSLPLHIEGSSGVINADASASFHVIAMLVASISLPFIALSSLSPSLQRLFAGSKRDPYFLFAASNLGSFGGLLAYPFLMEKLMGLTDQAALWQWGYAALFILCITCLLVAERLGIANIKPIKKAKDTTPISWGQKGKWVLLAFVPSSLMMGVTAHVTADTGAVPLFWIIPLGLYLLTFVLAFAKTNKKSSFRNLFIAQAFCIVLFTLAPLFLSGYEGMVARIVFALLLFYVTALLYHKMLSESRPDPSYLTQFYLWIALGGALGGMFNTFLAPVLFSSPIEFLFLALFSIYIPVLIRRDQRVLPDRMTLIGLGLAVVITIILQNPDLGANTMLVRQGLRLMLICTFALIALRPWLSTTTVLVFLFIFASAQASTESLETKRNFFGVLRVMDQVKKGRTIRQLIHGTTVHGFQQVKPVIETTPNSYYGPLGDVFATTKPQHVGMIGLGTGTALCYIAPNRQFTVYEINEDVIYMADKWFDFMRVCGRPEMRIGDGRKLLEEDSDKAFDIFVIDAFSSDAIPVHLLTREAVQLYFDRLTPNSVVVIHISNRFFDLAPQIVAIAKELSLVSIAINDVVDRKATPLAVTSRWVVLARQEKDLVALREKGWKSLPQSDEKVWTDDYSDMLSALSFNMSKIK